MAYEYTNSLDVLASHGISTTEQVRMEKGIDDQPSGKPNGPSPYPYLWGNGLQRMFTPGPNVAEVPRRTMLSINLEPSLTLRHLDFQVLIGSKTGALYF